MTRRLALVTGASSGIGRALAREFAANGWDLALVARRKERLEELAEELHTHFGVDSQVIVADLADADAPAQIIAQVEKTGRHVDALVNNAGYGLPGTYTQTGWADQARFIQLMLTSYAELVHRVMPGMQARGYGRILNVSSVSALMPGAKGHTLYAAVKSALVKFSQSLHLEGKAYNIHATALCPGFTYSEFHDVNETRSIVSKLPRHWWRSAEDVARAGYEAVQANRAVCVPGLWYKFLAGLNQVLPGPVSLWMMERNSAKVRQGEKPDGNTGPADA